MEVEQKRYKIKCPYCGKVQYCHPSIFHCMGLYENGSGECVKCERHMQIIFDPNTGTMKTKEVNV